MGSSAERSNGSIRSLSLMAATAHRIDHLYYSPSGPHNALSNISS
jgi:hypothetical protein